MRGVGGFYYVLDAQGQTHQLRAQAKLRRARLKPMVGDQVEFDAGHGGGRRLAQGHPARAKAQLARPPVANIDTVLMVIAAAAPEPDLMMADRLLLAAREQRHRGRHRRQQGRPRPANGRGHRPISTAARARTCFAVCARTGEGMDALRERLRGACARRGGPVRRGQVHAAQRPVRLRPANGRRLAQDRARPPHHAPLRADPAGGRRHGAGHARLQPVGDEAAATRCCSRTATRSSPLMRASAASRPAITPPSRIAPCARPWRRGKWTTERHARYVALLEEMKIRWRDRYG